MKTWSNHLSYQEFPEASLYLPHNGKAGPCFLKIIWEKILPRLATKKGVKHIHTLSIPQFCWCPIMSSGKRFSARIAQERREQETQHNTWLEGISKGFEVTYPTGATEIHIKLWFSLVLHLSHPPRGCSCWGSTVSPPLPPRLVPILTLALSLASFLLAKNLWEQKSKTKGKAIFYSYNN